MSVEFKWDDVWALFEASDSEMKASIAQEVVRDDWLFNQTARTQKSVLKHAPAEFVNWVAPRLKPELAIELGFNPYANMNYSSMMK